MFFRSLIMPKKISTTTTTKTMTSGSTPGSFPQPSITQPPHLSLAPPRDTETPPPVVTADKLESEELVKLLDIIDKLRVFGVSEDISLPQVYFLLYFFRPFGRNYKSGNKLLI